VEPSSTVVVPPSREAAKPAAPSFFSGSYHHKAFLFFKPNGIMYGYR